MHLDRGLKTLEGGNDHCRCEGLIPGSLKYWISVFFRSLGQSLDEAAHVRQSSFPTGCTVIKMLSKYPESLFI